MRILFMLLSFVAVLGFQSSVHAQTSVRPGGCTMSCGCDTRLCYCSRTGGNGGSCRSDGNACYVNSCAAIRQGAPIALAADGSLVAVKFATAGDSAEVVTVRPMHWRTRARGHSVGLDCLGVVVAEVFDSRAAAALRARSREMTI